jgi:transposase InsO family protein
VVEWIDRIRHLTGCSLSFLCGKLGLHESRFHEWHRRDAKPSRKGTGFVHALRIHAQWHTDISYVRIGDRFYFLVSFLDGFSRMIVRSELREAMTELDVNLVFQLALERFPEATDKGVRIISDNGKQFTGKEFRSMITAYGLTATRTSPYYPQANGKLERWHRTLKIDIRPKHLNSKEHAQQIIDALVKHYNEVRLHSAIGYVTPRTWRQAAKPPFTRSATGGWPRPGHSGAGSGGGQPPMPCRRHPHRLRE